MIQEGRWQSIVSRKYRIRQIERKGGKDALATERIGSCSALMFKDSNKTIQKNSKCPTDQTKYYQARITLKVTLL